jgi:superoxide dismutase, Cu-Zn family
MSAMRMLWVYALPGLAACASAGTGSGASTTATAELRSPDGASMGILRLERTSGGLHLAGVLTGLPPGAHGIHFHATGRCDAPDFASAGAHFNPRGMKHGLVNPDGPHAGDLPAIAADASGRAVVDATTRLVTLDAAAGSGLFDADGAAIIVHAASDDQRTDPSGNSGSRLGCAVVRP